jgi:hypothetical protein
MTSKSSSPPQTRYGIHTSRRRNDIRRPRESGDPGLAADSIRGHGVAHGAEASMRLHPCEPTQWGGYFGKIGTSYEKSAVIVGFQSDRINHDHYSKPRSLQNLAHKAVAQIPLATVHGKLRLSLTSDDGDMTTAGLLVLKVTFSLRQQPFQFAGVHGCNISVALGSATKCWESKNQGFQRRHLV